MPVSDNEKSERSSKAPRKYLSQSDVPAHTLQDALRVPMALRDEYGKQPTSPVGVARALDMTPTSGTFRMLTGAAVAYDITDGAAQAEEISLTPLGRRIVAPTEEGDDIRARLEALTRPRVVREFIQRYDSGPMPRDDIAFNVLEDMGVPVDAVERAYAIITENLSDLGLVQEIKGRSYLDLSLAPVRPTAHDYSAWGDEDDEESAEGASGDQGAPEAPETLRTPTPDALPTLDAERQRRVFISHGSNKQVRDQIADMLTYGDFEPVISVKREAGAKPVPDKVLDDMRACGAGIVHVSAEEVSLFDASGDALEDVRDHSGDPYREVNPNVLIEVGAAMALYPGRWILLVEKGAKLPSNLQGLYEVRYEGKELDHQATMKLLHAFKQFKVKEL